MVIAGPPSYEGSREDAPAPIRFQRIHQGVALSGDRAYCFLAVPLIEAPVSVDMKRSSLKPSPAVTKKCTVPTLGMSAVLVAVQLTESTMYLPVQEVTFIAFPFRLIWIKPST